MRIQRNNQKGFTLLEMILAISIFGLSIMGLVGSLIYGQQSNMAATHRIEAVLLADEGIKATQNIASENFTNLSDGDFGLVVQNNVYTFTASPDIYDIYARHITITTIDAVTKKVESTASWSQNTFDEGTILLTTYVSNWK